MRQQYQLYKRTNGGRYYIHDYATGKRESLGTNDLATAARLFHSRKEAEQQPAVNLQIARACLAAIKNKAFDGIRHLPILETRPEHFLRVLEAGKVSTNVYLRRIHNFALDMTWLPWPVLAKKR